MCLSVEGVSVDSVRADVDLVQTEWDVCARELQAARERVHTQSRVRAVSAELADLDRVLVEQDRWLDSTPTVEKCEKAQLRNLSEECQVKIIFLAHVSPDLLRVTLILNLPLLYISPLKFSSCSCRWFMNMSDCIAEMKRDEMLIK